jgi:hypothetical protein
MCVMAGHYGTCQIDIEPDLGPAPGQPTVVEDSPVCRPCYQASLTASMVPWAARRHLPVTGHRARTA